MPTKNNLIDRMRLATSGGNPQPDDPIQESEIAHALHDAMNAMLHPSVLDTNFNFDGGTIPDGTLLTPYTLPTTAHNNPPVLGDQNAQAQLPIIPILLPYGAGVWSVVGTDGIEYIPLRPGELQTLASHIHLSPLLAMGVYHMVGAVLHLKLLNSKVPISQDVKVQLCVMDFASMGGNDPIPVPADMVEEVYKRAYQMLTGERSEDEDTGSRNYNRTSVAKRVQ